jgi:16S rRNA (guanine(966)-N(2))-methyltransferase RsmD
LRIISGTYKGRVLHPPAGLPVRPTTDLAKSALFNILENLYDLSSMNCLDLFCGTGNISFEFISRGCPHVVAVDRDVSCLGFVRKTANALGMENLHTVKSDALRYLKNKSTPFNLVFADPPFDSGLEETVTEAVLSGNLLTGDGIFILEHFSKKSFSHIPGFQSMRRYGSVAFSFFHKLDAH